MAKLMTGIGREVVAQQDADLYAGIVGSETIVLKTGYRMKAAITGKNTVSVQDGVAVKEGRAIYIEAGTVDDFEIPAAEEYGVIYEKFIGYRIYTASDGTEKIEPIISNKKSSTSGLRNGAQTMYVWLYKVTQTTDGVEEVIKLFEEYENKSEQVKYYSFVSSEKVQLQAGIDKKYFYNNIKLPAGNYLIFAQCLFGSVANATGAVEMSLKFDDADNNICRTRVSHNTAIDQAIQCSAPVSVDRERTVGLYLSSTTKRNAGGAWIKAMKVS